MYSDILEEIKQAVESRKDKSASNLILSWGKLHHLRAITQIPN